MSSDNDNKTFKIDCKCLVAYEDHGKRFIPYDAKDPRGFPFPPGQLPYSKHSIVSDDRNSIQITLQHGPYLQAGENGTYEDSIIALARDLLMFKNQTTSPLRCREYSTAITHLEEALSCLSRRAARLQAAGVHGTGKNN